jgi:putative transposase
VDLGVADFAVTSDAQRIANPRHLQRRARQVVP